MQAKFIVFDGLDGSGKSTAARALSQHFTSHGIENIVVREPGGSLGGLYRSLILNHDLSLEAETFSFFADRFQHLNDVIVPALDRGVTVICDRFSTSTYLYQVVRKGFDPSMFADFEHLVWKKLGPHFSEMEEFLFVLPFEVAQQRLAARADLNRLDILDRPTFDKCTGAIRIAAENQIGFRSIIDAAQSTEEILKQVLSILK